MNPPSLICGTVVFQAYANKVATLKNKNTNTIILSKNLEAYP